MLISCIVATANNRVIGKNNQLPWYLPDDLKYFKKVTQGHTVIMGRKCYESIGRPLPKRINIVLTRDPYYASTGIRITHNIEEALQLAEDAGEEEVFIIGGGKIYKQTEIYWDKLYLTEVDLNVEGDVFFPQIDFRQWQIESAIFNPADEKNPHNYTFKVFTRKSI